MLIGSELICFDAGELNDVTSTRLKDNGFALPGFLPFFPCPLASVLLLINLSRQCESMVATGYEGSTSGFKIVLRYYTGRNRLP